MFPKSRPSSPKAGPKPKRAYVLADNQLALNAGWDEDLLRVEIGAIKAMDFDIGLAGLGYEFLSSLFATPNGQTDPDDVPEPQARAATQRGDVWVLGSHRIMCGDSTNKRAVEAFLGQEKPHLMVTDPPYGVEYDPTPVFSCSSNCALSAQNG